MHPHATDLARFWAKVDVRSPDECWLWRAGADQDGYGRYYLRARDQNVGAHRYAFFLVYGRWPKPHCLHRCDRPPCCNPGHLREGTNAQNMLERHAAGHYALGEAHHSAKLTAADVPVIRARLAAGESAPRIAADYGIRHRAIYDIKEGKTWRHVR